MGKIWGAVGLIVISLFMLLGFLSSDETTGAALFVALLLTVVLPAAGAGLLLRSHFAEKSRVTGRRAQLRQQTIEAEVMSLAGEYGGRLTAVEVATRLALTPEGAKEALDSLARREMAELEVTDDGLIVYNFHAVKHLKGKDTARGILDA